MFQHGGPVPPQPGMPLTLNHKYPSLDEKNIRIADGIVEFRPNPKGDGKKRMLLNNFDASVRIATWFSKKDKSRLKSHIGRQHMPGARRASSTTAKATRSARVSSHCLLGSNTEFASTEQATTLELSRIRRRCQNFRPRLYNDSATYARCFTSLLCCSLA